MADRDPGRAAAATDTPTLAGLGSRWALLIAAVWTATEAARALVTGAAARAPGWWAVSVLAAALATWLLLRATKDPIPLRPALLVAFLPAVAALASPALTGPPDHFGLYGAWTWPVGTIVQCFLVLRGRLVLAWAGQLALGGVVLWWWYRAPAPSNVTEVWLEWWWNTSFLSTCTVLGVALRYQVRMIDELRATAATIDTEHERALARNAERDSQLAYLNVSARPLLERIAAAPALGDTDRAEIALVEAQLRDRIRARGLASEELLAAAREARERGVSVVLLDDGALNGLAEPQRERARQAITAALRGELADAAADSTVTARILPPGRRTLATFLNLSKDGVRRREIAADPAPPG